MRDLGKEVVTGPKVRNGSLVTRNLAPGVGQAGAKGPTGPQGATGDTGPVGDSAVSRRRIEVPGPIPLAANTSGFVHQTEYTAEPGRTAITTASMNITRTSGSCTGSQALYIFVNIGTNRVGTSTGIKDTVTQVTLNGGGYVDQSGSTTVPLNVVFQSFCPATFEITGLTLDVVHVN